LISREMNKKAAFDDSGLRRVLAAYASATGKGAADIAREATARFVRHISKTMPPFVGGAKRKDHTAFLRRRVLEMHLPRGRLSKKAKRERVMTKQAARAYYRKALEMQGELISGWNAAATLAGVRPQNWISRHGKKHGSASEYLSRGNAEIRVSFSDNSTQSHRTNISRLVKTALQTVERGFAKNAEAILKRRLRKAGRF